ncbi:hypothetical protein [Abyssisolibacter fermentans]|uniref:hypothetical protein n=1 Tax=Abyssisolibacter fermentans TaxID=1766203 RepID=UPI00082E5DD1|nr:hypothetical protein [Abyssisolibacter fermentans]
MKKRLMMCIMLVIVFMQTFVLAGDIYKPNVVQERYELSNNRSGTLYTIEDKDFRTVINQTDDGHIYRAIFNKKTEMMKLEELTKRQGIINEKDMILNSNLRDLDNIYEVKTLMNYKIESDTKH